MSAHTPGPWQKYGPFSVPELNGRRDAWTVSAENDSRLIAEIYTEANAALISAAPDLLIVAESMVDLLRSLKNYGLGGPGDPKAGFFNRQLQRAENAVVKAGGLL